MLIAKIRQLQNVLLLAVLVVFCLYTALALRLVSVPAAYTTSLLNRNYIGFVAVAVCLLSYVVARRFFKRVLGFTLLLAVFRLAVFLPTSVNMGLRFGDVHIGIDPIYLLLLAGYYLLNRQSANTFLRQYVFPAPTPQQATRLHREAVDQFKQTFARKTDDNLRQIVQERKLVTNAVAAAQELLQEREAAALRSPAT